MFKFIVFFMLCGCASVVSGPQDRDALVCPTTYVHAARGYVLTANDQIAQKTATQRCKFHYPESPCLKMFEVIGFQDYHAICGKP